MSKFRYHNLLDEDGRLTGIHQYYTSQNTDPFLHDLLCHRFKPKQISAGYVYVLRDKKDGAMKIGSTYKSVKQRIYQIKISVCGNASDTEFIHAIMCHDIRGAEEALHWQFGLAEGKRRSKGLDYFYLWPVDLERIRAIRSYNGIPVQHIDSLDECAIDYSRRSAL